MGIIRNSVTRRFKTLGLLSDLALVGAAANQMIQRRNGTATREASMTEMALAGGAAMRLFQRLRRRSRRRKASSA